MPHKITRAWVFKFSLILLSLGVLAGCATAPPYNDKNACAIFNQYPDWYWKSLSAYRHWGVPISVQLAIIRQESHFKADAATQRKTVLGFIPWGHITSAYGYAQAIDATWKEYQKSTGRTGADRDDYGDAVDFIGWYANNAHKQAGISKRNAYELYLAYHEGIGGYQQKTYNRKPWLIQIAHKVQHHANVYRNQIAKCKYNIPEPSFWNLWFWRP